MIDKYDKLVEIKLTNQQQTMSQNNSDEKSWYNKAIGRSLFSVFFGTFFEKKNNTAGIIAILVVGTLCFVLIYKLLHTYDISKETEMMLNIVFVVIGYYFGSKQQKVNKEEE